MNRSSFQYRSLTRIPVVIIGLCLVGIVLFEGDATGKDKKGEEKKSTAMVDAIVNRNKAPKIVFRSGQPDRVALFADGYDWKEEERVRIALDKLYGNVNVELWEELVR